MLPHAAPLHRFPSSTQNPNLCSEAIQHDSVVVTFSIVVVVTVAVVLIVVVTPVVTVAVVVAVTVLAEVEELTQSPPAHDVVALLTGASLKYPRVAMTDAAQRRTTNKDTTSVVRRIMTLVSSLGNIGLTVIGCTHSIRHES